jgi:hypothetical protein
MHSVNTTTGGRHRVVERCIDPPEHSDRLVESELAFPDEHHHPQSRSPAWSSERHLAEHEPLDFGSAGEEA